MDSYSGRKKQQQAVISKLIYYTGKKAGCFNKE